MAVVSEWGQNERILQRSLSVWLFLVYHLVSDHMVRLPIAKWGEGSHLGRTFTPILKCKNHFLDCACLLAMSLEKQGLNPRSDHLDPLRLGEVNQPTALKKGVHLHLKHPSLPSQVTCSIAGRILQ